MKYVGARYMPKFVGTYDATTIYEALSVVDNGMGTSYITNKPTPAGTPLTDTEYWSVYGASSGAILDLENRMTDAENDIVSINNRIGRDILIIGNSYVNYGCAAAIASMFIDSHIYTEGGAGFLTYTSHSKTYVDCLDDAIADATLDKSAITHVLFVSAMGDTRAYNENPTTFNSLLATALDTCVTKIRNNFPNAHEIMLSYAETRDVAYFSDNKYNTLFKVHKAFKKLCNLHGFNYLGWSGFNTLFSGSEYIESDNYHPTSKGAAVIGQFIKDSYLGHAEYKTIEAGPSQCDFRLVQTGDTISCVAKLTPETVFLNVRSGDISNADMNVAANGVLINLAELSIPIPAPEYDLNLLGNVYLVSSGGIAKANILPAIQSTAEGMAVIRSKAAISQPAGGVATVAIDCLHDIFYYI